MSHIHVINQLISFSFVKGRKAGMVGNQWCHHCQDPPRPVWYSSHFSPQCVQFLYACLKSRDPAATAEVWTSDRWVLSTETFTPLCQGTGFTVGDSQSEYIRQSVCSAHIFISPGCKVCIFSCITCYWLWNSELANKWGLIKGETGK